MNRFQIRRALSVAALSVLALSSVAATLVDKFPGTAIAAIWAEVEQGAEVRQSNGKVLFSVSEPASPVGFAGLLSTAYSIDFTKSWTASFSYGLNQRTLPPQGVTSGAILLMGFDDGHGGQVSFAPIVYRTSAGTFVGYLNVAADSSIALTPIGRAPASGTLQVKYTAGVRTLEIATQGGGSRTIVRNFGAGLSSSTLWWGVGCVTLDEQMTYTFNDAVAISNLIAQGPGIRKQ